VIGIPATGRLSLIAIGTPANGRGSPDSIASASSIADSCATWVNALIVGSSSSIRARESDTSSTADTSPERTMAASSPAGLIISVDTERERT